jgi:anti-anti-sigma factor
MRPTATPSPFQPFSVSVVPNRAEVLVVASGELDLASAGALEREVQEVSRRGFARIVIDLRDVTFLDSAGLRLLLSLRNDAKRAGPALALMRGPQRVQRIFDITGTRDLFEWRDR